MCMLHSIVTLTRDGEVIGTGKVMLDHKTAHGYHLTKGWICVEIKQLQQSYVPCWEQFPTLSDEIEVGSFSAWPIDELIAPGPSGM